MSIWCKIFGHEEPMQRASGWYSPGEEYAQLGKWRPTDGIGITHANVVYTCDRCGEENIPLCRIHLPKEPQPGLTPRGTPMPQTLEEWKHLADIYEKLLLEEKETNSKHRSTINKLRNKLEMYRHAT